MIQPFSPWAGRIPAWFRWLFLWLALGLSLRGADGPPPAPPEWILVHSPNLAGATDRPLRYRAEGTDFVIENGREFFNRPLYSVNSAFRTDGGDKPEFSLYVPGRGGNLRFGIQSAAGVKWLNDALTIVTRYRPGSLRYALRDPLWGGRELQVVVLPLAAAKGMIARVECPAGGPPLELIWAFGGANGMRGSRSGDIGCEREPVSQFFQLRPDQCRSNEFSLATNAFTLRSRTVTIAGVASGGAQHAVADANRWADPAALLASSGAAPALPVVVGRIRLAEHPVVYLTLQPVGEGIQPPGAAALPELFSAAETHRQAVAERVVVETPDPFINAAAAAINVAGDAIWEEAQGVYMHGAVAWRNRLLGWRGPYTGDALGWHDRAERHLGYWTGRQNTSPIPPVLPPADAAVNLARNEAALHSNGDLSGNHYDMNLVYVDAAFRHYLWTGDLEFMRWQWPVIERHLAWERRLFRRPFGPEALPLYEGYAAIWASDDLQYGGGGAAHATAYNYFHNRMAARIAPLLQRDPAPYQREADLIGKAMREYLWLGDRGWFAESKDYLGRQLAHPNAALWTFYHVIDSEVPTPMEAWQMTRFVDTQIAHLPIHGPGVPEGNYFTLPTTSWMPYLWSINNVVMAEAAHTSLACWQAGRPETAFPLFKGCLLDSMFMGLCPGNVGAMTDFDMARREAQRDFADAIGVCSRTMVEGLFGIHPDAPAGELRVQPGFPAAWEHASMRHPDFTSSFVRTGLRETYQVEPRFPKPMGVRFQVAALRSGVASVQVNGRPATWRMATNTVGGPRLEIWSEPAPQHELVITWRGERPMTAEIPAVVAVGQEFHATTPGATAGSVTDPQQVLREVKVGTNSVQARAAGLPGQRSVWVQVAQGDLNWALPMAFELRPALEIVAAGNQDAGRLRFRVRNNTAQAFSRDDVKFSTDGIAVRMHVAAPPFGESDEIVLTAPTFNFLPGTFRITMESSPGAPVSGSVINWKLPPGQDQSRSQFGYGPAQDRFRTVDLAPFFNDRVTQIFRNEYLSPRSPFCSLALPKQGLGGWCDFAMTADIDDAGLRRMAATNGGRLVLPQGVPFQTPGEAEARNVAFASQWDNYPREISAPLNGRASRVYLLMAGSSNPMQSRFDNGEVIVTYADGSTERLALENPVNWWPIDQDYFIDDYAFRRPEPIPPRVDLKTGRVRLLELGTFKGQGGRIAGGSATVLDLPLDSARELKSITVRSLANEVVIGLMAVTLAR